MNREYAGHVFAEWREKLGYGELEANQLWLRDSLHMAGRQVGEQQVWIARDGRFRIEQQVGGKKQVAVFDGEKYWQAVGDEPMESITATAARLSKLSGPVVCLLAANVEQGVELVGRVQLDGSDKVSGLPAVRMKIFDASGDWFYVWFQLSDSQSSYADFELVRASGGIDNGDASFEYDRWENRSGWLIPGVRQVATEASGEMTISIENLEMQASEIDAAKFSGGKP